MELSVARLKGAIAQARRMNLSFSAKLDPAKAAFDFSEQKKIALINNIKSYARDVMRTHPGFILDLTDFDKALKQLDKVPKSINRRTAPKKKSVSEEALFQYSLKLPTAISGDIRLDLKEVELTYKAECFRSSVILCGRVLETSLQRKYYEMTGKDILETAPGIGAGKLVAKLKEQKVPFDPGVTEQIHLINQVRISSVHKKQEAFMPSKNQTQAIILFTLDILKKLFK